MVTKLRKLEISEVSSVDRAANRRARVLLRKREETPMPVEKLNTVEDVFKRCRTHEDIVKASNAVLDVLTRETMAKNPGLSWDKARSRATMSAEYSEAHRQEKLLKHGPGF